MSKLISRLGSLAIVSTVGGVGLFAYYKDPKAAIHERVLLPVVRKFVDGEDSHRLAINLMKYPWLSPKEATDFDKLNDPTGKLQVVLFQNAASSPKVKPVILSNPIGIAAGFDKNAEAIDSLFNLGFSYVEVGSVTPLPQPGNPRPRVFRLEKEQAVINRYGFNSDGHFAVLARLKQRLAKNKNNSENAPEFKALAVNLGKNKLGDEVEDYVKGVERFASVADALVINVSSPNTPGLRTLQAEDKLTNLLKTVVDTRNKLPLNSLPPLLVKIAPDLSEPEVKAIAKSITDSKVDGIIVSNTTIDRSVLKYTSVASARETGGLSGAPIKPRSLSTLKTLRKYLDELDNHSVTVVGCGGISNADDVIEFHKAGADFVQLYTSFAYKGPGIVDEIKGDLVKKIDKW